MMPSSTRIPENLNSRERLFLTLFFLFLAMFAVMFIYEYSKQMIFPGITIWESHFITIVFTSVLAVFIVYFPLRSLHAGQRKTEEALQLQQISEKNLQQSYALLNGIMDSPEDIEIFALDRQYRYLAFNDYHRRMMKKINTVDIAPGMVMTDLIGNLEDRNTAVTNLRRALYGESFTTTVHFGNPGTDPRWFSAMHTPIRAEPGTIIGIAGYITDVTENKRAEEALGLAYKKINLLSSITRHDVKNQLMILDGLAAISGRNLDNKDKLRDCIARERKVIQVITGQLNFTRDYEELGVKAPQWQNVSAIAKSVSARLMMRDIAITVSDTGLEVLADPLLEKVFFNLIDNALNYGGDDMTAISITTAPEPDAVVIIVEDNGAGISAEDKPQIFTRGFGKNTGLGLFLCREILSITGITITEDGEPGRSARFRMSVPKDAFRRVHQDPAGVPP
jgi:signal transduction histidine kinase